MEMNPRFQQICTWSGITLVCVVFPLLIPMGFSRFLAPLKAPLP